MEKVEAFRHYQRFREEVFELTKKLVPIISDQELFEGVRRLGIPMRGNTIEFGAESEMSILMDFCLHAIRDAHGTSLAERILEDPDAPLNEHEREVLAPLAHSRFMIIEVVRIEPGLGVYVRNLLNPGTEPFLVMDYQFSRTAIRGLRLAGRLAFLPEFTMTTGACLPLGSLSQSLPDRVRQALSRTGAVPNAAGEFDRAADAKMNELAMSMLIAEGQGETIAYRQLSSSAAPGRHTRAGKTGKGKQGKR